MKIVNIVATVKLTSHLNLKILNEVIKNTEFAQPGCSWLKMRLKPEGKYIAFYKSGKFLITGVKSIEMVNKIAKRVLSILKAKRIGVEVEKIEIHNVVASGDLKFKMNLDLMSISLERALYEPEVFPGLIYRMKNPDVIILIFASGKIVCVGAKSIDDVKRAQKNLLEVISELDLKA